MWNLDLNLFGLYDNGQDFGIVEYFALVEESNELVVIIFCFGGYGPVFAMDLINLLFILFI